MLLRKKRAWILCLLVLSLVLGSINVVADTNQQTKKAEEAFWQHALQYGRIMEDTFNSVDLLIDGIADLHDFRLVSFNWYNVWGQLKRLTTKNQWQALHKIKQSKQQFRCAFTHLVQSDDLVSVSEETLRDAYVNLQKSIIDFCNIASNKNYRVSIPRESALSLHMLHADTLLKELQETVSGNKKQSLWHEKVKNLLWGSTFSYHVLPIIGRIFSYFVGRTVGARHLSNMLADPRIADVVLEGGKQARNVSESLFKSSADNMAIVDGLFQIFFESYKGLQTNVYNQRTREEERALRRAKNKINKVHESNVSFSDIIGYEDAKKDVRSIIEALANPVKFMRWGGQIPKGVLLEGPPGTGKTLFARAIAYEAKVPVFLVNSSELIGSGGEIVLDPESGYAESNRSLQQLFCEAIEHAPSIVFIDELDFIGKGRNYVLDAQQSKVLAELLAILSGFTSKNPYRPVLVIAATNCAAHLDQALTRSDRFDLIVHVDFPSTEVRKALFEKHLAGHISDWSKIDLDRLAQETQGCNCADIVNIVTKHAHMIAQQQKRRYFTMDDLLEGITKVKRGLIQ